ncbi:TPA: HAUS augmin-like complex, subunit 5, variant 2 [Trebouxia sp. C0004]
MSTDMTAANTSQGMLALHKLLPTASASLSRQIKTSLSKQAGKITSLPALQHDADTAAIVSHLSQQPSQLVLQAVADGSMHAAEEVHAITDALDLQIEAKKVQMSSTAGIQGVEGILRAKQESHVKQFLLTEVALQAGHAAQQQIQALSADVQRQTDLYEQLIAARREVAGAKAVIAVVEAQLAGLEHESEDCSNAKAELLHKWDQIRSFQARNTDMDALIKLLYKDNMWNRHRWETATAETKNFLVSQLLPGTNQVKHAATAMHNCMASEQAALDQIVLHQLPRQTVSGDSKAPCAQLTLHRWQQALQDASTPYSTTSANASQATPDGLLDILQHAAWQHPVALVQSPDVLLEHVIELSCKKQQHMFGRSQWNSTLADAEAVAAASAHQSTQLQHAAAEAFHRIKDEDMPCLAAVVQSCQSTTAFAKTEVKDAITEWWTQPAVHAVPWVQHEGKNAAEWLIDMRAMHAAASQC